MLKKISFFFVLSFFSVTSLANTEAGLHQQLKQKLNSYLKDNAKAEQLPGISMSYLLPTDNKIHTVNTGSIGYPPYQHFPIQDNTLFQIGSITKSYAATIILQLEGEGMLSINDKLGKWLPEYPAWQDVTIKQLLNMTSNIPSYTKKDKFLKEVYSGSNQFYSVGQLLAESSPNKKIERGVKFDYSNTNYILAEKIIEKITKDSFANQLQKRILQPFHLANTYYPVEKNWKDFYLKERLRIAHGYYANDKNQPVDITDINLSWGRAAGAIIATSEDTLRWAQLLYTGEVFAPQYRAQALKELETFVSMKTGKPINQTSKKDPRGFGLGIGSYFDSSLKERFLAYEGSSMGYRAFYIYQPCNHIIVAVTMNSKGGEGKNGKKDKIEALAIDAYKTIVKSNPKLQCS